MTSHEEDVCALVARREKFENLEEAYLVVKCIAEAANLDVLDVPEYENEPEPPAPAPRKKKKSRKR